MPSRTAEQICLDLEDRGLSPDFAASLAPRLARVARELGAHRYDALLAGAVLCFGEHRRMLETVRETARDLEEMQHLLTGFSDELRKLDEALETLAAYAVRMKSQPGARDRILH